MNTPSGHTKDSFMMRRFTVIYAMVSLIPFVLLFYLYSQFDEGDNRIAVSRDDLTVLIVLVGFASALGFFILRSSIAKIARLAGTVRKELLGQIDRSVILNLIKEEGEVAELARSFNDIIGRLESNIAELKQTKRKLYEVVGKVGQAFSSLERFDVLIKLILETASEALSVDKGYIFSIADGGGFALAAHTGADGADEKQIMQKAAPYLDWISRERAAFLLPKLDQGQDRDALMPAPLICSPLAFRGKIWGAICLAGHWFGKNFSEDELSIIESLGAQIAVAFENARLNEDRERVYFETISALALAVEARDPYSRGHSEHVGELAVSIGASMKLNEKDIQTLRDASRMHDIGKIGISDAILQKAGPLTAEERQIMKNHPQIGESIVMPLRTFQRLLDPIRHHHEYLDGSGYPDALTAEKIPLITRIMVVADIFDALMGDRPYREALSLDETLRTIDAMVAQGRLDCEVVGHLRKVAMADASA